MFLFAVLFLFVSARADVPDCNGVVQMDPPVDTSQYTWYPNNFTNTDPPRYPNDYSCTYKFNVPQGWSASIILSVNMTIPQDQAVSVRVIDQNQNSEAVWPTSSEHFFMLAPGGRITLDTRQANVRFGFAVKWWKFNDVFDPFHLTVAVDQTQPAAPWAFSTSPYQVTAETKASLVVVPPTEDILLEYLRSIIIYDGPDWNSPILGNALQLYFGSKQWVSTGKQMSVVQLKPYYTLGNTMLVFQDYENTKDIVQFQGISCTNPANCGIYTLDGSQGPAAMVSMFERSDAGAEYLTTLSGSGLLDVYIGGRTKSKTNLIASYVVNSSSLLLPQEFLGYVRTYVLTGKNAVLGMTRRTATFSNSAAVGRKGFFASRSYKLGAASPYQDVYDTIGSSYPSYTLYTFSLIIREVDFVGNTTLSVVVNNQGKNTYNQVFSTTNSVPSTITAVGTDLSVSYKTYGQSTKGFYLDFQLEKSSARFGFLISLCLFLIYTH